MPQVRFVIIQITFSKFFVTIDLFLSKKVPEYSLKLNIHYLYQKGLCKNLYELYEQTNLNEKLPQFNRSTRDK